MGTGKSDPVAAMSDCLSGLYVSLEDFTEEGSTQSLLKVLAFLRELRIAMGAFEQFAIEVLRRNEVPRSLIAASLGATTEGAKQHFTDLPPACVPQNGCGSCCDS
jgi:hypothetical protein